MDRIVIEATIKIPAKDAPYADPIKIPGIFTRGDSQAYALKITVKDDNGNPDYANASAARLIFTTQREILSVRDVQIAGGTIAYDVKPQDISITGTVVCSLQLLSAEGARLTVGQLLLNVRRDPMGIGDAPMEEWPDVDRLSEIIAEAERILLDLETELDGGPIGNMSTATYDTDKSGIVDNAERLGGKSAKFFMEAIPTSAPLTILFDTLADVDVTGTWNAEQLRVEF